MSRRSVLWTLFLSALLLNSVSQAQIMLEERGQAAGIWTPFSSYGVSVNDYDRDGWDDILFVGRFGVALLRNDADGTFTDVTESAGLSFTAHFVIALWVDWDNDGDDDLFLGRRDTSDQNRLLANMNGSFVDVTAAAGIDPEVRIGSAAAGDYDNDGFADLYLSTRGGFDMLYRNTSDLFQITFENMSELSGMKGVFSSIGMQPTWIDYDQDGDQDMFVVHDGFDLSRLHNNPGALPFPNLANPLSMANVGAGNSMGVSWGDIDNDGWQDVYVSRIDSAGLYRNTGSGPFEDVAAAVGADSNGMTWGVVFADMDNDGWEDLPMVNVSSFGGKHPRALFFHNDRTGSFSDIGGTLGFDLHQDFYGLSSGDFDNDGRVDLVGASFYPNGQNRLWMNRSITPNHWIRIGLAGQGGVNRSAIGARIRIVAQGNSYIRTLFAGSSYCSQISPILHVGLGTATLVDTLEILWKGDHKEILTALAVDTLYRIQRSATTHVRLEDDPDIPQTLSILGVYPNPFNGMTQLRIRLGIGSEVSFALYDMLGRELRTQTGRWMTQGEHAMRIDATGLSSGLYVAIVRANAEVSSAPILLVQ